MKGRRSQADQDPDAPCLIKWLLLYLKAVSKQKELLWRILKGSSDANIPFAGLRQLLHHLGFEERIRGSHHIFAKTGVVEILNIQAKGAKAKPYQVRQVRNVILKYRLGGDGVD